MGKKKRKRRCMEGGPSGGRTVGSRKGVRNTRRRGRGLV